MIYIRNILLFTLLLARLSFAQNIPVNVTFDTVLTNTTGNSQIYIKNTSNKIITIKSARSISGKFIFGSNQFIINPNDSFLVTVYFKTNHNITYRDFLIFETSGINFPLIHYATATAKYIDTLYRFTQGLTQEGLKTALRNFTTQGYISLGYNIARDKMFETIDDYGNNDTIECVYTGLKIKAANRTEAQNQGFNTEHTYPQSYFNENEPMRSDLHHLFPTEENANNYRSNYSFGIVVSNITWQQGGSKLGKDFEGQTVFEPRDVHKGDVARCLFYFCVKYGNPGMYMAYKQESVLRFWNNTDTVSQKERTRNDRIKTFQNNRSPFVDHPEFIERIKSIFSTVTDTLKAQISAAPDTVIFDTLSAKDTSSYYIGVMNYGNIPLIINSVTSSLSQFTVESFPSSVPAGQYASIKVKFRPTETNHTYSGVIGIQNSDSNVSVNVLGFSNNNTGITKSGTNNANKFELKGNYPNPFNPETVIEFSIPSREFVTLKIFDLSGREVASLVGKELEKGNYKMKWNAGNLSCGVFLCCLKSGIKTAASKMILIK